MAGFKSVLRESEQLLTEAFNSKPYEVEMMKKGASDILFNFTTDQGTEYQLRFRNAPKMGKTVRRVTIRQKQGGTYKDVFKQLDDPMRVIATFLNAMEQFVMTPLGKRTEGMVIDFSKKALGRGAKIVSRLLKTNMTMKKFFVEIDTKLVTEPGMTSHMMVRKGKDAAKVFNGSEMAGIIGGEGDEGESLNLPSGYEIRDTPQGKNFYYQGQPLMGWDADFAVTQDVIDREVARHKESMADDEGYDSVDVSTLAEPLINAVGSMGLSVTGRRPVPRAGADDYYQFNINSIGAEVQVSPEKWFLLKDGASKVAEGNVGDTSGLVSAIKEYMSSSDVGDGTGTRPVVIFQMAKEMLPEWHANYDRRSESYELTQGSDRIYIPDFRRDRPPFIEFNGARHTGMSEIKSLLQFAQTIIPQNDGTAERREKYITKALQDAGFRNLEVEDGPDGLTADFDVADGEVTIEFGSDNDDYTVIFYSDDDVETELSFSAGYSFTKAVSETIAKSQAGAEFHDSPYNAVGIQVPKHDDTRGQWHDELIALVDWAKVNLADELKRKERRWAGHPRVDLSSQAVTMYFGTEGVGENARRERTTYTLVIKHDLNWYVVDENKVEKARGAWSNIDTFADFLSRGSIGSFADSLDDDGDEEYEEAVYALDAIGDEFGLDGDDEQRYGEVADGTMYLQANLDGWSLNATDEDTTFVASGSLERDPIGEINDEISNYKAEGGSIGNFGDSLGGSAQATNVDPAYAREDADVNVLEWGVPYKSKFKKRSPSILGGFKNNLINEGARIKLTEDRITFEIRVLADDSGLYYPVANWREELPKDDSSLISAPRILEAILEGIAVRVEGNNNLTTNSRSLNRRGKMTRGNRTITYDSSIDRVSDRDAIWKVTISSSEGENVGTTGSGNFKDFLAKKSSGADTSSTANAGANKMIKRIANPNPSKVAMSLNKNLGLNVEEKGRGLYIGDLENGVAPEQVLAAFEAMGLRKRTKEDYGFDYGEYGFVDKKISARVTDGKIIINNKAMTVAREETFAPVEEPEPQPEPVRDDVPSREVTMGNWTIRNDGSATHYNHGRGRGKGLSSLVGLHYFPGAENEWAATIDNVHTYGYTNIANKLAAKGIPFNLELTNKIVDMKEK